MSAHPVASLSVTVQPSREDDTRANSGPFSVQKSSARPSAYAIQRRQENQAVAVHGQHFQLDHHVREPSVRLNSVDIGVRSITARMNGYPCRSVESSP